MPEVDTTGKTIGISTLSKDNLTGGPTGEMPAIITALKEKDVKAPASAFSVLPVSSRK